MKENYSIEDLTFQMEGMAIYRAKGADGQTYALTVLTYPEEIICRLTEAKFEKALRDLLALRHRSVSKVTEGGLDERDQQVWVTHRWNVGRSLQDIINHRPVEATELLKLKQDADSVIATIGDRADALSFLPRSIFLGQTSDGELLTKFVMDYWRWFHDWALGSPFGGGRDAGQEMVKLLTSLDNGSVEKTGVHRPAIAPPPVKGPMIVLPGSSGSTAPQPVATPPLAPVEVAPAPLSATAPPPPKTRRLVTAAPAPTSQLAPAPPPKTRRLVTSAPAPQPAAPVQIAQPSIPTIQVTTSVPPREESAAIPAPAPNRALVTNVPVRAPLSAPLTKTGVTLSSSKSGGGNSTIFILALLTILAVVMGVMVANKNKPPETAVLQGDEYDDRLGNKPKKSEDPAPTPKAPEKVTPKPPMPKVEPRPFVPITPPKVEPRPADPEPAPRPEPVPVVKKLPEVAAEIRPDVSQITEIAATDTAGLAAKVNTWVRIKGEVASTSVDGEWAFVGETPLIAQLRDGQLAVVTNKQVEILGWLAGERLLIVAEEFDISEPGASSPAEPANEDASSEADPNEGDETGEPD